MSASGINSASDLTRHSSWIHAEVTTLALIGTEGEEKTLKRSGFSSGPSKFILTVSGFMNYD